MPPGFVITTEVCQEFYRCGGWMGAWCIMRGMGDLMSALRSDLIIASTLPLCGWLPHPPGAQLPPGLVDGIRESVADIERDMGRGFGSAENPLLLSVRSGAAVSLDLDLDRSTTVSV